MTAKANLTLTSERRSWPSSVKLRLREHPQPLAVAHIAKTFWSRFVGLLGRRRLPEGEGLLFVPGGSIHTLAMRFPIDVVFIDANLTVLRISRDVSPWRFVLAPQRTRFVLELNGGALRDIPIRARDRLAFE